MRILGMALSSACVLMFPNVANAQVAAESEPEISMPEIGPSLSVASDPDARELVKGSNEFSLNLLRALGRQNENLIMSPSSVTAAVGFAYRGAKGETALQLQQAMRFPFEPIRNLKASGAVLQTMSFAATGRELRTANSLWLQDGMPLDEQFEKDMEVHAKAAFLRTDFKADAEAARGRINGWVDEATRSNIKELLKPGIVTNDTRAVLVNAIWFKAEWSSQFAKEETRDAPFTAIDGAKSMQPLMNQRGQFQIERRGNVSAIQLPYVGGEVALTIFLPDDHKALTQFEQALDSRAMAKWFANLDAAERRDTILALPKLKLRWGANLADTIAGMGASIAFSDYADFSGMAKFPYPGGGSEEFGLKIKHVIHEATVAIDESGSEASAATAVVMDVIVTGSRKVAAPPPFIFRADKPFFFALRDLRTGLILFMGRYVRPDASVATPVS